MRSETSELTNVLAQPSVIIVVTLSVVLLVLLVNHAVHSEVRSQMWDDAFHLKILTELRARPWAYKEIYDRLYRQSYADVPTIFSRTPFLFYIWLLLPDVQSIKWLYLTFSFSASLGSYFAIRSVTNSLLFGVFSALWMAWYMQKPFYLMFEYWAISIFLVSMAFFVKGHHRVAAILATMSALIKEVFAPFLVFAAGFYFLGRRKREFVIWGLATLACGSIYLAYLLWTDSLGKQTVVYLAQLNPNLDLQGLFDVSSYFFNNPPLPMAANIILALIGMSVADKDQRRILYASFFFMPLLMFTAKENPPYTVSINVRDMVLSRWLAMPITLVGLFWLAGIWRLLAGAIRRLGYAE
jgi:hypothetical protein